MAAYTLSPYEVLTEDVYKRFLSSSDVLLPPYAVNPIKFTVWVSVLSKQSMPAWLGINAEGNLIVTVNVAAHTILWAEAVKNTDHDPDLDPDTAIRVRQMTTFYYNTQPFHVTLEGAPVVTNMPLSDVWSRIAYAIVPNTHKVEVMDTASRLYVCVVTLKTLEAGTALSMTR
jgi:hypothetical protein